MPASYSSAMSRQPRTDHPFGEGPERLRRARLYSGRDPGACSERLGASAWQERHFGSTEERWRNHLRNDPRAQPIRVLGKDLEGHGDGVGLAESDRLDGPNRYPAHTDHRPVVQPVGLVQREGEGRALVEPVVALATGDESDPPDEDGDEKDQPGHLLGSCCRRCHGVKHTDERIDDRPERVRGFYLPEEP